MVSEVPDSELAVAAAAGDRTAFAAIYDRYANRIYGVCLRRLRNSDAAADVTQETFLVAAQRLAGLTDPSRLRPWLFAVARNQLIDHVRRARRYVADEGLEMATGDTTEATVLAGIRAAELADLMAGAQAGLDDRDRLVLDLAYREELAGGELADALGVRHDHVHQLLSRARRRLETSLGALLVARQGREDCLELADLLQEWDGRFSTLWRKRVARHVEGCDTCTRLRAAVLSPASLAMAMPVAAAPPQLRDQVLTGFDDWIASGGAAGRVATGGAWLPDGFPGRVRSRRLLVLAVAATLAVLMIGGTLLAVATGQPATGGAGVATGTGSPDTAGLRQVTPTPVATTSPAALPSGQPTPSVTAPISEPAQSITPTTALPDTPTRTGTGAASTTPATTTSATTTPEAPATASLVAAPSTVTMTRASGWTATFRLSHTGTAAVDFVMTAPAGFSVTPSNGTLDAGEAVPVLVTRAGTATRTTGGVVTVTSPTAEAVEVTVQVLAPQPSPTATAPATR